MLTQSIRQWWSRTTEVEIKIAVVVGGVIGSRECESRVDSQIRVANVSREWSRKRESRVESQNMGRECGLRMWVVNVSRKCESQNGVMKI